MHSFLRRRTVDPMYIIYENVLHCHTYSLPSCIHGHNTLHRAALFAAVADHAGDWQTCENQVRKIVEQVQSVKPSL